MFRSSLKNHKICSAGLSSPTNSFGRGFLSVLGTNSGLSQCASTPPINSSIWNSKRNVWTLSPLLEEANKVTLWRCERFFTFKGVKDKEAKMQQAPPTSAVEDQLRDARKTKSAVDKREATVIVNGDVPLDYKFNACWNAAHVKVCADGGANKLFDFNKEMYIPDHIIGDLDSSKKEVLEYYKKKGVAIIHETDQESTDLQKALHLLKKIEVLPHGTFEIINVLGGIGGNFTHEISNLNSLYHFIGKQMFMVSPHNVAFLLPKGRHLIRIVKHIEDHEDDDEGTKETIDDTWSPPTTVYCGLLPLGERCLNAMTKGLRWNLNKQPLEFGALISTSNEFLHNIAEVEVSNPVIFTLDFRDPNPTV